MNSKLVKKLRKLSQQMADANGYPGVEYRTSGNNKTTIQTGTDVNGLPVMEVFEYTGTITVNPKSARGIYKVLKKNNK